MILKTYKSLENDYKELFEKIVEDSFYYDGSPESYNNMEKEWNLLYKLRKVLDKKNKKKTHYMSYDGKQIYICDYFPMRYKINEELLSTLTEGKEYYTQEEIDTLLRWTVNNTRDNLMLHQDKNIFEMDVTGCCGLAQFSALRPLEKIGLKVRYNNISQLGSSYRHAFGTVIFPTKDGEKKYLIDPTYAQFFKLERCVSNFDQKDVGFYMRPNKNTKDFAETLLKDGYVEATMDNLYKYSYGFLACEGKAASSLEGINVSEGHDYTDEELEEDGMNITIKVDNNKKKL